MQELAKALEDVKCLHERVLGRPAPELGPQSYAPFPAGVDPLHHALLEVQNLKEISAQVSSLPRRDAWVPPADSFVTKDEYIVRLEVPGVPREDLNVSVVGNECVVRGERKAPEHASMRPMAIERPWGPFERRFAIPTGSRVEKVKARAHDGVLELRIPMEGVEIPKEQKVDVA